MAETATKLPIKPEAKQPERAGGEWRPLANLRREIDRLFEDFPFAWPHQATRTLFDVEPFWRGEISWTKVPAVDIAEREKEYEITAEVPGMDERNVEVKFADGILTIKGEKKEEKEVRRRIST